MRNLLLIVLLMFARDALCTEKSLMCLLNKSPSPHHIEVANVDNYDWEGDNRPDKNFNNITIAPGATICRYEDVNIFSAPRFTFVIDNNPTRMRFASPSLRAPSGKTLPAVWWAYSNPNNPTAVWGYNADWKMDPNWLTGAQCNVPTDPGRLCVGFELR